MNIIPNKISARSRTFALMFLSLNIRTPQMKEMITELRRTRDTTDIIESGSFRDVKYAKSPMQMNMDMSGMAQFHLKGVLWWRFGYHSAPQIMHMMTI